MWKPFEVGKGEKQVCLWVQPAEGSGVALTPQLISHLRKTETSYSFLSPDNILFFIFNQLWIPHVGKWVSPQIKPLSPSILRNKNCAVSSFFHYD